MNGCINTRVEAFRLFVADLFMTTNQVSEIPPGSSVDFATEQPLPCVRFIMNCFQDLLLRVNPNILSSSSMGKRDSCVRLFATLAA